MSSADNFHRMKLLDSGLLDTGTKTTFSHYNQILIITIFFFCTPKYKRTQKCQKCFFSRFESVCVGGVGWGWGEASVKDKWKFPSQLELIFFILILSLVNVSNDFKGK